jgi:hypothetical protein
MLPPGMGPLYRGLSGAGLNILGQIAADETPIEDISDLNALSIALSGGLGALGSDRVSDSMRGGIDKELQELIKMVRSVMSTQMVQDFYKVQKM